MPEELRPAVLYVAHNAHYNACVSDIDVKYYNIVGWDALMKGCEQDQG